jgi:hypothetical protein
MKTLGLNQILKFRSNFFQFNVQIWILIFIWNLLIFGQSVKYQSCSKCSNLFPKQFSYFLKLLCIFLQNLFDFCVHWKMNSELWKFFLFLTELTQSNPPVAPLLHAAASWDYALWRPTCHPPLIFAPAQSSADFPQSHRSRTATASHVRSLPGFLGHDAPSKPLLSSATGRRPHHPINLLARTFWCHVIPNFVSKIMYSSYVCLGLIVPHIRTKSVHR